MRPVAREYLKASPVWVLCWIESREISYEYGDLEIAYEPNSGANMPTTLEAIHVFRSKGVIFGPAKAVNAGTCPAIIHFWG